MQDQVEALNARGVPATFLASTVESGEIRARMARPPAASTAPLTSRPSG